jgi:hypothetical protein
VKIRFGKTTGHNKGSVWFSTYDGPAAYGIRIGYGRQPDYISGVRITGKGTIDMNASHNVQPGFLVKDINACVLVHGRVRNVLVEGITMQDTNRSVMCYGEHSGKFLPGGEVGPGESFDAENITILQTRTLNPNGAAYLLGHPSFRGKLRNVKCNYNYMETGVTAIEPNFNLDGYEVIGNVIKSGGEFGVIHCWRYSKNGVITDNLRIHDYTTKPVVALGAPKGWQSPERPVMRDNRNHLSEFPGRASTQPPPPFGRRLLVSDYVGNKVAIIAADGRVEWQTPAEKPQDSWLLPNGNVLFSHVHGAKEVRPNQSVAWEYVADSKTEVQGCQPLADGRVLVVECGTSRLIEVDRDGKIAKEIQVPLVTTRTHEQMRGCRKQPDGRYLVSAKGDRAVLEFSSEGKLLRTQPVNGDIHDVRELANGHWLVALGEGDGVVEYDRSGNIVWSIGRNEIANNHLYLVSSVERLTNGHTVIMNWLGHGHLGATAQIFEIDANKQVIRQFTDHQNFASINHIQVLE